MAFYIPRKIPLNWYEHEVSETLTLMHVYVADIEAQVAKGIAEYKQNKTTAVEKYFDEDRVVTRHRGLDDRSFHIHAIFESYFPNLQRMSALITLYSYFEHELDDLCDLFAKEQQFLAKVSDMTDTGMRRSALYLSKIAKIDSGQDSAQWEKVLQIKHIRNLIVHHQGMLGEGAARKKREEKIIENSPFLGSSYGVDIKEGYLRNALNVFDDYFKLLDKNIRLKGGFPEANYRKRVV